MLSISGLEALEGSAGLTLASIFHKPVSRLAGGELASAPSIRLLVEPHPQFHRPVAVSPPGLQESFRAQWSMDRSRERSHGAG